MAVGSQPDRAMARQIEAPAGPASADTHVTLVRFGPFEANLEAEFVRSNGSRLRLQQQPFQVLALLLERPGELVTREDLRQRLWPDDLHVDFEHSLNTAIKKVRFALHDTSEQPLYIETVRGRGYRFVAPVERIERPAGPSSEVIRPARWIGRLGVVAAVLAAMIAVVVAVSLVRQRAPERPSPRIVPLTSYPGRQYEPTFSPDGSHLAFVWWRPDGNHDIYVQPVDVPQPHPLAEAPELEHSPAWSPDGRWIAFIRDPAKPEGMAHVILEPPQGGPERVLTEYPGPRIHLFWQRQLAWTPDSRYLVLSRPDEGQGRWSLFRVDVSSGQTIPLTRSPERDVAPAVSPDGRTLAFGRQVGERGTIQLLPLSPETTAAGPVRTLVGPDLLDELGLLTGHMPVWTPDGKAVVFAAFPPAPEVYVVNVSGPPQVARIRTREGAVNDVTFSPRTGRFAYTLWLLSLSILRLDLPPGGSGTPVPAAFNSTESDCRPLFSPAGGTVAFLSGRRGGSEIWLSRPDGSDQRPLLATAEGYQWELSWSPDGERIAYAGEETGGDIDVYVAPVAGRRQPRRLTRDPAQDREPCWSPDGRWIYFTSTRDGGRRIWRQPAEGGPPERVTAVEGTQPQVSADGRFLYFARGWPASVSVWRMPTEGGQEERVLESVDAFANWRLTREGIYFFGPPPPDNRPTLFFYDLASARTQRLAVVDGPLAEGLTVSPDGKTLFFAKHDDVHADVMLQDWP
jgi:Tol biopolymer transport system component/DNA-binding winged helix-turn-helix (wHTH) protein